MKTELLVKEVEFLGDTLIAAQDKDGKIYAGVRWICKGLGLSEGQINRQLLNINDDIVISKGVSNLIFPTNGGNQEILCLQLDFVPLWLAKISITPTMQKNNFSLVNKLVEYQLKAKDALAAAFLPTYSTTYEYMLPPSAFEGAANLGRLVERIMKLEGSAPHEIAIVLKTIFEQAGIHVKDCFVKIPSYEQLSLPEIISRK